MALAPSHAPSPHSPALASSAPYAPSPRAASRPSAWSAFWRGLRWSRLVRDEVQAVYAAGRTPDHATMRAILAKADAAIDQG